MSQGRHQNSEQKQKPSLSGSQLLYITFVVVMVALIILCVVLIVNNLKSRNASNDPMKNNPGVTDPDPNNPSGPDNPVDPVNPDDPVNPNDPVNPDDPVNPSGPQDPDNPQPPVEPDPPDDPPTPSYTGPINPLTGEPVSTEVDTVRPYAVILNNVLAAVPQSGIAEADFIYEVLVEGGITRLLALYTDVTAAEVLGSIRSARPYFLELAQGHDAILIHGGASTAAYVIMGDKKLDFIDGVNGNGYIFYRDSWRREHNGYAHSLMVNTSLVSDYVTSRKMRTKHAEGFTTGLAFTDLNLDSTSVAREVKVKFSTSKSTSFSYNEQEGLYYVSQYGASMRDKETDERLAVKNVLVLETSVTRIAGDEEGRLEIKLTGSGSGYLIRDGVYTEIKWSKADADSPFKYTLADGTPVELGRGVTYACITSNINSNVTFS